MLQEVGDPKDRHAWFHELDLILNLTYNYNGNDSRCSQVELHRQEHSVMPETMFMLVLLLQLLWILHKQFLSKF